MSAREIDNIADRAVKKENLKEFNRHRVSPSLKSEPIIVTMNCLGIPEERITEQVKINRKTVKKHAENQRRILSANPDTAAQPQPLDETRSDIQ